MKNYVKNELIAGVRLLPFTQFLQIPKYEEHEKCVKKVTLGFINEYKKKNQIWRSKITEPVQTAINNWIEYTFQAVNLYKASHLFYKDISEQIQLERKRGKIEFNGYANYDHPLPLFRNRSIFWMEI